MLVPISRLSSTHNGAFCTYIYARRRHNMLEVGDRAALLTGAGQTLPCDTLALYGLELWIYRGLFLLSLICVMQNILPDILFHLYLSVVFLLR